MYNNNDWSNRSWAGPNAPGAGVPRLSEQGNPLKPTGPSVAGGGKVGNAGLNPTWFGLIVVDGNGTYVAFDTIDAVATASVGNPGSACYGFFVEYREDIEVVNGLDLTRGFYSRMVIMQAADVGIDDWAYEIYGPNTVFGDPPLQFGASLTRAQALAAIEASAFKPQFFHA